MRRFLCIIPLICLLITGCTGPGAEKNLPFSIINPDENPSSLDIPWQAVSVTEFARHTPPDDVVWPTSAGEWGQTGWLWDEPLVFDETPVENTRGNVQPVFFTATVPSTAPGEPSVQYDWTLFNNRIGSYSPDNQPPFGSLPLPIMEDSLIDIPGGSNQSTLAHHDILYFDTSGESELRFVNIDDSGPIGLPTINSIFCNGSPVDLGDASELSATDILFPMERDGSLFMLVRSYVDDNLSMPEGTTRIVPSWWSFNLLDINIFPPQDLSALHDLTFGATLTGFAQSKYHDIPQLFFLSGISPHDEKTYAFICSMGNALAIETDIRFTRYIPAVFYNDSLVVFSEPDDADPEVTALMLSGTSVDSLEVSVLWKSEVPLIFSISTTIPVVTEAGTIRPYIVCLNPIDRTLTVFDPLLGLVRSTGQIDISEWREGNPLPSFCVNFNADPEQPYIFIHDPAANELIELHLDARAPSEGSTIVPVE